MEQKKQKGAVKLQLKKQSVSNLSQTEMEHLKGGDGDFTTSWNSCTGWGCCAPKTETITITIALTIVLTGTFYTSGCND
jgi:natural product precursor